MRSEIALYQNEINDNINSIDKIVAASAFLLHFRPKKEEEDFAEFDQNDERNQNEKEEFNFFSDYTDVFLSFDCDPSIDENIWGKLMNLLPITQIQRAKVLQWMNEICDIYRLSIDTFSLSVYVLDKYLISSLQKPLISQIQLLASCCLLIAAKYEDGYYPSLSELVYMCDGLYKKKDFINMQNLILETIHYRLTRHDARFNARLKLAKMEALDKIEIEENFFVSVDFVFKSSLFSPFLTFASINNYGDALIDTTSESEISDRTQNQNIKMYILDSLEIAQEFQESN